MISWSGVDLETIQLCPNLRNEVPRNHNHKNCFFLIQTINKPKLFNISENLPPTSIRRENMRGFFFFDLEEGLLLSYFSSKLRQEVEICYVDLVGGHGCAFWEFFHFSTMAPPPPAALKMYFLDTFVTFLSFSLAYHFSARIWARKFKFTCLQGFLTKKIKETRNKKYTKNQN